MNTEHSTYKKQLEEELASLKSELKSVGRINPDNPADWEAVPAEMDTDNADSNIVADKIEEFEENSAVLKQLESRYNEVIKSLEKIENGTFGKCEICGKEIEPERLMANSAATTCQEHMNNY
jgi:RNA polymerase-binding transcription factor DksA